MTLISSISGTRGTIGGIPGDNLTPMDIVRFTGAFGTWLSLSGKVRKVVIGRDARPSGEMVRKLVSATLIGMGFEVIDLGLSTTPSVEMAVQHYDAAGGIVITASHNPVEWNALKLLNQRGEFLTQKDGNEIMEAMDGVCCNFVGVEELGKETPVDDYEAKHIEAITKLNLVDTYAIRKANLSIVVDAVNSSGGIYVPQLLRTLGVRNIIEVNCEPTGWFAHNPEPLAKNLTELCDKVKETGADIGIAVDPDVDRLVMVDENGVLFGEEYTLVAVADYVLRNHKSAVVSNLSSSRALRDVAEGHGCTYHASAVGEVNVIEIMKRSDALIGGEGNGGIIFPELHYGRDALVGIALFLSHLVKSGKTISELRATYPDYYMSKQKLELTPDLNVDALLDSFKARYRDRKPIDIDGVKVDFEDSWVHLRKSNTEPIIRIYTEARSQAEADALAARCQAELLDRA